MELIDQRPITGMDILDSTCGFCGESICRVRKFYFAGWFTDEWIHYHNVSIYCALKSGAPTAYPYQEDLVAKHD